MKSIDYFKYSLDNKLCQNIQWYYSVLSPSNNKWNNDYYKIENDKIYVSLNGNYVEIEDKKPGESILGYKDSISIDKGFLENVDSPTDTTVGRVICNYVLLSYPFGSEIPFINKTFSAGDVENIIADKLFRGLIKVPDYITFVDNCSFLQPLSKIIIDVATKTNITAPDGIEEYKKKVKDEFTKEYGEEWEKDTVLIGQYSKKIEEYDNEYLKDDPTVGKILSKKMKGNARKKMYLTIGSEKGFDGRSDFIQSSLSNGFPKNNKDLSAIFNSSRLGSFDRGHETQKGGAVAKELLRAAGSIKIVKGDCGSKILKEIVVTDEDIVSLRGLYMEENGKIVLLAEPEKYIGKKIKLRTPLFCKLKGKNFCSTCVGTSIGNREDGVNLLFTTVSEPILTASLKGMHDSTIQIVKVSLRDTVK